MTMLQKVEILEPGMMSIKGRVRFIRTRADTGEVLETSAWKENLIMFGTYTGRDIILKRLIGDNTYSLNILYCDIGTSASAPATSDTQLGAAVARVGSPVMTQVSNTDTFSFFFPDASLANGTYYEIGTFIDGTSSVNTGKIFNHALFASSLVKGTGEDVTIQIDFTLT